MAVEISMSVATSQRRNDSDPSQVFFLTDLESENSMFFEPFERKRSGILNPPNHMVTPKSTMTRTKVLMTVDLLTDTGAELQIEEIAHDSWYPNHYDP
jgi:hypothetical protein